MSRRKQVTRLQFRGQINIIAEVCQFFLRLNARWEHWTALASAIDGGDIATIRAAATTLAANVFHRDKPMVAAVSKRSVRLDGKPEVALVFRRGDSDYVAELTLYGESVNLMLSFWGFVVGYQNRGWLDFSVDGGPAGPACAHLLYGATDYAVGQLRPGK